DFAGRHNLPQIERDVIPGFLPRQRWFAAKDRKLEAAWLLAYGEIAAPATEDSSNDSRNYLIAVVQAQLANDEPQLYLLPLAALWRSAGSQLGPKPPAAAF